MTDVTPAREPFDDTATAAGSTRTAVRFARATYTEHRDGDPTP
jgi:hypothetical protein